MATAEIRRPVSFPGPGGRRDSARRLPL